MGKDHKHPPKFLLTFFRWFCHPDYVEDIEGDLLERFEFRLNKNALSRVKWIFFIEILKLLRPGLMRPIIRTNSILPNAMIKNYIKIAFRNMVRHKAFSVLNVAGLCVGIACSILIMIYVQNELSHDKYNEKYDRTYRILSAYGNPDIPSSFEYQVWGCAPVGPALLEEFPQVESMFRFTSPSPWLVATDDRKFQEDNIVFADSSARDVFSWKWLKGNPKTALNRPHTIVLTKKLAEKYFGNEDPVGKTLLMKNELHGELSYEVTGVMENIPANSHFTFDGMVSMKTMHKYQQWIFDNWSYVDFYTYFTIKPETDLAGITDQIPQVVDKYAGEAKKYYNFQLEPLSAAYLYSDALRQPGPTGSLTNIYMFVTVAIFVLLIACINFMNLSTARAVERAKEVAIRKVIGSFRTTLIAQFLIESMIIVALSALLAVVTVILALPFLEILSGKQLSTDWLLSPQFVSVFAGGTLMVGLLSGSYPALVLSNFKPAKVLKGAFKTSSSGTLLRESLVVLQFALSIILLVGTTVVFSQLDYLREHELGYDSEQLLILDYGWDEDVQKHLKYIKSELANNEHVESVAASRAVPGFFFPDAGTQVESPEGEMIGRSPAIYEIDEDFIPTYQMEIVAGRNYSRDFPADSANALILNEAAAKQYGYTNTEDIIGKKFSQWGRTGQVVGVVKDFNYVSLHDRIEPLSLRYSTAETTSMFSLRLKASDMSQALASVEDQWNELVPHRPMVSYFLDQNFNAQYEADDRFGSVFSVFSGIAMFIACLGLLGLTIYSTAQRAKEIGIRKVLGASVGQIVSLLSRSFVKLFLIALCVAVPLSWYVMNEWLQNFAYSINIGWGVFAMAAIITLLVSLITMSFKTVSVAVANPVNSLKDE